MQAVILAAGMGKRLKELTKDNTKCMVKVNGITLIERMLRQIDGHGLSKITIVVGYEGKKLIDFVGTLGIKTPIDYVNNTIYNKTNNIYSLFLVREKLLEDDTLLFESDIIFDDAVLDELIADPRDTLAVVAKYEPWMSGTCVKLGAGDTINSIVSGGSFDYKDADEYYKTVNIYKFAKHFSKTHYVPFLEAYQVALGKNEYYEQVLRVITMIDASVIKAKILGAHNWYEIDDIQDLDIAESLFAPNDDKHASLLLSRYGGYWRYPRLLDFCYLVNPYYPPKQLMDEMKASFDTLLTEYPSGMRVNSLLCAKNFGVNIENILVGNGAAELIKALMERLDGKLGIVRPTFDEYPNRLDKAIVVEFTPNNCDFSYTADDLIKFFGKKGISALVVINPDNPSGNYIKKADLLRLIEWAGKKKIRLVVDESFVDFADEENSTVIETVLLNSNPHLVVMKSISKSYGVPGIRLGVLASGDTELIEALKKDVAIWNINSFGEFYLQIMSKYRKDFDAGLVLLRRERKRFEKKLAAIKGIRVIPSQANYVMVELVAPIDARVLLNSLLAHHSILVKELKSKVGGNYLRFAVRNTDDNNALLAALKTEIKKLSK
ncbi:MAG: aminotransferase class I/II-fold pyridoxal phosphate-dependent enzyme [Clostridia bacterium]|nr:aminotransferase class I/II-fold pyridoxal phosphate-dependent enzyme [Clostridia bacterium]